MKRERAPIPVSHCTNCGWECDDATGVATEDDPSPGDFTVCIECGHLMAYADDLTLRDLTDAEVIEIAGDSRIIAAQRAIAARNKQKAH